MFLNYYYTIQKEDKEMEKTTTRTNETVTVNVNLDAFIIPNKANRAGDWFLQSDRERHATIGKRVAEAANKPYNTETDKLVQLLVKAATTSVIME